MKVNKKMLKLIYKAAAMIEKHKTKEMDFSLSAFIDTNLDQYFTVYRYYWNENREIVKSNSLDITNESCYKYNLYNLKKFFNED